MEGQNQNLANDIFKGISGILWFFYRVFFTMVPTFSFLILTYMVLKCSNMDISVLPYICNLVVDLTTDPTGNQLMGFIIVVAFLNIILEAIVIRIAYRVLGFESFCATLFSRFLIDRLADKLKKLRSPVSFFSLINSYSLLKSEKVFEYIQYQLAREFLFNNTWVLLLTALTFLSPLYAAERFGIEENYMAYIIPVQFLISCFIAWSSFSLVKATKESLQNSLLNENTEFINDALKGTPADMVKETANLHSRKKISVRINRLILVFIAVGIGLLLKTPANPWLFGIGLNIIAFTVCYFLISAAFREFVNVEAIVHYYYLIDKDEIDAKVK